MSQNDDTQQERRKSIVDMQDMAERAARSAVEQIFTTCGADIKNPLELQTDFRFLRTTRERCEKVQDEMVGYAVKAACWIVILGGAAILGIKNIPWDKIF